jgi:hypothetical protein
MLISIRDRECLKGANGITGDVLCIATLCLVTLAACGGSSSSGHDTGSAGTGGSGLSDAGASPTGGAGGPSGALADAAAINCSYVPCLATAVSVVAGCRPSQTCTYQTMPPEAVVRCFDNGLTIIVHNPVANMVVMGVKKDGNFCYGVDSVGSGSPAVTVTYRDGSNATMLTVFIDDAGETNVLCPEATGSFTISPSNPCMAAVASLGGVTPGSACVNASEGDCSY